MKQWLTDNTRIIGYHVKYRLRDSLTDIMGNVDQHMKWKTLRYR